jgi:hypothetical protein
MVDSSWTNQRENANKNDDRRRDSAPLRRTFRWALCEEIMLKMHSLNEEATRKWTNEPLQITVIGNLPRQFRFSTSDMMVVQ